MYIQFRTFPSYVRVLASHIAEPMIYMNRKEHLKNIVKDFLEQVDHNFDNGGRLFTKGGWPKLAASTIRHKGHNSILLETGDMSNKWRVEYEAEAAIITNEVEYSSYHEFGTKHCPQRIVHPDEERIFKMISKELNKVIAMVARGMH